MKLKSQKITLLLTFILSIFSSCENDLYKTFENDDFYLKFPAYFTLKKPKNDGFVLALLTPRESENDDFIEKVLLSSSSANSQHFDKLTEEIINGYSKTANLLKHEKLKINNETCLRVKFRKERKIKNKTNYTTTLQQIYLNNDRLIILTYVSESENFDKYYNDIDYIFSSFKIK